MSRLQKTMISLIIFSLVGFGFSAYSIYHHQQFESQGTTDAACNVNSTVNCDAIAASPYSEFLGYPLGNWGQGFFTALMFTALIIFIGQTQHLLWLILLVTSGLIAVLVLGSLSAQLGNLCLICAGVYISIISAAISIMFIRKEVAASSFQNLFKNALFSLVCLSSGLLWQPGVWVFGDNLEDIPTVKSFSAPLLSTETFQIPVYKSPYSGTGEDYRWGNDQAPVTIVKFSDFQCPACKRMARTLKTLKQEYGQGILIVYKNFPLDSTCNSGMNHRLHEHACLAATLARCAGTQGKFSEFHDKVFDEQHNVSETNLITWAKELGLNDEQITTCRTSQAILAKIKDDLQTGDSIGITGTPSVYINGRKALDTSLKGLRIAIEAYLKK